MSTQNLEGAYYGPSVLPPPSRRRRYSPSCCCCNPFSCLCKCIFNLIFKLIITIVVLLGIVLLILYFIFRPSLLKFHINNASINQFDLTDSFLRYDFAVNASVLNPNSKIGIYYDEFQVDAFYKLHRFSAVNLMPFFQEHENTTDFEMKFLGQQVIEDGEFENYDEDKRYGVFEFGLKLKLKMRLRIKLIHLFNIRIGKFKGKVHCDVKIPMRGNAAVKFEPKKCDIAYV